MTPPLAVLVRSSVGPSVRWSVRHIFHSRTRDSTTSRVGPSVCWSVRWSVRHLNCKRYLHYCMPLRNRLRLDNLVSGLALGALWFTMYSHFIDEYSISLPYFNDILKRWINVWIKFHVATVMGVQYFSFCSTRTLNDAATRKDFLCLLPFPFFLRLFCNRKTTVKSTILRTRK